MNIGRKKRTPVQSSDSESEAACISAGRSLCGILAGMLCYSVNNSNGLCPCRCHDQNEKMEYYRSDEAAKVLKNSSRNLITIQFAMSVLLME